MSNPFLKITKLGKFGILILKQSDKGAFFTASPLSVVISTQGLLFIIRFLIINNLIDVKIIEGILEEYHSG